MAVDNTNKKGMFLLTGSSDMFKNSKIRESLAGRIASFNFYPLSYAEIYNAEFENVRDDKIIHLDKLLKVLASKVGSLINYTNI
jgi:predicted AAA+ superfamily ATPase